MTPNEYQEASPVCSNKILRSIGVYIWINRINGKVYVGSTVDSFKTRKRNHLAMLRNGIHHSIHFQRAWDKYGEESFIFDILEVCYSKEECVVSEQYWIDYYNSANCKFGYNRNPLAQSSLGIKRSEETRAKISAVQKGRKPTEQALVNIRAANHQRGKPLSDKQKAALQSPEARAKRAAKAKGRKMKASTRFKLSIALKGNTNSRGRVLSEEHKRKIGLANSI